MPLDKWKDLQRRLSKFYASISELDADNSTQIKELFEMQFGSVEKLLEVLETSQVDGISTTQSMRLKNNKNSAGGSEKMKLLSIDDRRSVFGENKLQWGRAATYCEILGGYFKDIIIILLTFLSLLVLIVQAVKLGITKEKTRDDWIELFEPIAILLVVLAVLNITTYTDYKQLQAQEQLRVASRQNCQVTVRRNGGVQMAIASSELLVGDVVLLNVGDTLAADGICVSSFGLTLNESALTGESHELVKDAERDFMLYSPTDVTDGTGTMLVLAVGINSTYGKICRSLNLLDAKYKNPNEANNKSSSNEPDKDFTNNGPHYRDRSDSSSPKKEEKARIELEINQDQQQHISVLQHKLSNVSKLLTVVSLILGLAVLVFRITVVAKDYRNSSSMSKLELVSRLLDALQLANMIIVVGVPEGVLIAITMTAAIASKRMRKDGCNVQNISACETMGNATVICSDKTGTLTQNKMSVEKIYTQQGLVDSRDFLDSIVNSDSFRDEFRIRFETSILTNLSSTSRIVKSNSTRMSNNSSESKRPSRAKRLTENIIGNFMNNENQTDIESNHEYIQFGNKTECALLGLLADYGIDVDKQLEEKKKHLVRLFAFNSSRKYMASIVEDQLGGGYVVFVKGASEIILEKCTQILCPSGSLIELDDTKKSQIKDDCISYMANSGFRTLTIAYRMISANFDLSTLHNIESSDLIDDLNLICIIGIADPIRPEVPKSVQCVKKAGVKVIMVTGDNINTAKYIASQCGIYNPNNSRHITLTGAQFSKAVSEEVDGIARFSQKKFDIIWPSLKVLARSRPEDKKILVEGIISSRAQNRREIVAVTGDGTNDSLALKSADVGFAMGSSGTDMARNAADVVIQDDNFTSIVKALLWGRNMYDAVTKFLQFQLTVNITVLLLVICTAHEEYYPLHAIPLLWLNLLMDTMASLSLATDWPHKEQLERKPRAKDDSLISKFMIRKIVSHSIFQIAILLTIFFTFKQIVGRLIYLTRDVKVEDFASEKQLANIRNTFVFHTLVMFTLFNEFNSRMVMGERKIFARFCLNSKFIAVWSISFVIQAIIVLFLGDFIGLISLYKLPIPEGVEHGRAGLVFWFLFVPITIGMSSLLLEQLILVIIPNRYLRDKGERINSLDDSRSLLSSYNSLLRGSKHIETNKRFNYRNALEKTIKAG